MGKRIVDHVSRLDNPIKKKKKKKFNYKRFLKQSTKKSKKTSPKFNLPDAVHFKKIDKI